MTIPRIPIAPNEEARVTARHKLAVLVADLHAGKPPTLADVDAARRKAMEICGELFSRMDMDDLSDLLDRVIEWGEA